MRTSHPSLSSSVISLPYRPGELSPLKIAHKLSEDLCYISPMSYPYSLLNDNNSLSSQLGPAGLSSRTTFQASSPPIEIVADPRQGAQRSDNRARKSAARARITSKSAMAMVNPPVGLVSDTKGLAYTAVV